MTAVPRVSLVTLNFNQTAVTLELLASLEAVRYPELEVIVVDNGSRPEERQALRRAAGGRVRLVESPTNLGFTGGNNLGIAAATGDYLLLLNNDTEVEPRFLEPLVEALEADPELGIACPKIRYFEQPEVLQYAGGEPLHPLTGRGRWVGNGEVDRGQHDRSGRTRLAHGAAMLLRRTMLEQIGLLGDDFFIYYEELDLSSRAGAAGWGIAYVAEALVLHKESRTVGKENAFKTYHMTRNRLLYLRRNARGPTFVLALAFFGLAALPMNLARLLLRGRFDLARAAVRGAAWHLARRRVQGNPVLLTRWAAAAGGAR